jgi:histidine triad (HIT) family protein
MDCIFCKIISKEIPAEIVFEDENSLAFLDIFPRAPGHTVVIPKTHSANIIDSPEQEIPGLFLTVKKITGILQSTFSPDGFTIGINHGEVAGQSVPHLHVHIMPRFKGDKGSSLHGVVNNPPKEDLKAIAQRLRIIKK